MTLKKPLSSLIIIVTSLLVLFSTLAEAQTVSLREAMQIANESYEAGQYGRAAAGYEAIVTAGVRNSDVYFNLGNAYFKQGDLGRAILNYRRAETLAPRDDDIKINLQIARAQTVDQIDQPAPGPFAWAFQIIAGWLSLNEAALAALGLWLVICFLLLIGVFLPGLRYALAAGIGVVALFLVIGMVNIGVHYVEQETSPEVVIVAQKVDVSSGPGDSEQYLTEFILHAGAEAHLVEQRPDWWRISLAGGELQGWIPAVTAEIIVE